MNLIQSWQSASKLTMNVKKTKNMLIGSQFKLSHINSVFTVKVNNTPLERIIINHLEFKLMNLSTGAHTLIPFQRNYLLVLLP